MATTASQKMAGSGFQKNGRPVGTRTTGFWVWVALFVAVAVIAMIYSMRAQEKAEQVAPGVVSESVGGGVTSPPAKTIEKE